jgi:adenine-specific DNA-methyltransferase
MIEIPKEQELLNEIDKLHKQIEIANNRVKKAKYGLIWMDVPEAFDVGSENQMPVLEEVKEKAIKNDDKKPTHILIEGDNYHALTCLNYTHKEKIDLIYIDPPYNTGTDGFKYKDKRVLDKFPDGTDVPKDHPLRHSYWLSFMSKRMELAINLLKPEGVMFISIDDNESAQLKLLCDKIFGESNYVGCITWERKRKGSHLSKKFTKKTEYLHIYAKKGSKVELFGSDVSEDGDGPLIKRTNSIKELEIRKELIHTKLKDGIYNKGTYGKGSSSVELLEDIEVQDNKFTSNLKLKGPFVWQQSYVDEESGKGAKFFIKTKNFSLRALKGDLSGSFKALSSLFTRSVGTNENAKTELSKILNLPEDELPMSYPKPSSLIEKVIKTRSFQKTPLVILDFFAGSGTTGHATLKINNDSNSNHQFILVTNNENGIMDNACYQRIANVINGYSYSGKIRTKLYEKELGWSDLKRIEKINKEIDEIIEEAEKDNSISKIEKSLDEGIISITAERSENGSIEGLGNSISYYRTAFVGKNNILSASDEDKSNLAHKAGYLLAIAENTLDETKATDYYQFFENAGKITAVYFKEELDQMETFLEEVESIEKSVSLYLFSWSNQSDYEGLFDHIPNITIKTIPQPILEIYKNIYNIVSA